MNNSIHATGEQRRISLVTMIALKKPKATKRGDLRIISLTADTAKIVAGILRWIERKIEDVLGEDRFGFKRGRGTGAATGI